MSEEYSFSKVIEVLKAGGVAARGYWHMGDIISLDRYELKRTYKDEIPALWRPSNVDLLTEDWMIYPAIKGEESEKT